MVFANVSVIAKYFREWQKWQIWKLKFNRRNDDYEHYGQFPIATTDLKIVILPQYNTSPNTIVDDPPIGIKL